LIVDTSALLALIGNESTAEQVATVLVAARDPAIAEPTLAETLIVLTARYGPVAAAALERVRTEINLHVVGLTEAHVTAAQRAYQRFGKGGHPARLNLGDCMTYATAELAHQTLLATDHGFAETDLEFGEGIVGYWPSSRPRP
jgi:ribonuclease VapC